MQFKLVALTALAAGVSAQQTPVPSDVQASVLSVLLTALPGSVLAAAATNQPAFESQIAASISAGKTPDWYVALPSDVKSLLTQLYPVSTPAATTPSASGTPAITSTPQSSGAASASGTNTILVNSTVISTVSSATLASTRGANSNSASGTASGTAASTGGASYPTAVVGAGVAGAIGFLGMLAL